MLGRKRRVGWGKTHNFFLVPPSIQGAEEKEELWSVVKVLGKRRAVFGFWVPVP